MLAVAGGDRPEGAAAVRLLLSDEFWESVLSFLVLSIFWRGLPGLCRVVLYVPQPQACNTSGVATAAGSFGCMYMKHIRKLTFSYPQNRCS